MSTATASQFFTECATGFDAIYGNGHRWWMRLVNHRLRASMRLRFERTLEVCWPLEGRSVLDIGCGPGHYSAALALRGAEEVAGVDFAPPMIELARSRAARLGVAAKCRFSTADFSAQAFDRPFDYAVVMGFMDYVDSPQSVVEKVLSLTCHAATFSFPVSGGPLAWQRRFRYRRRCPLYLYDRQQVETLFRGAGCGDYRIERIARDWFVVARP